MDSNEVYQFKKQLRKLKEFKGSGTELISVYIGTGSPLHDTTSKLREEMSQASNIKSKSTKTNVLGALERILQHFKIYKSTPEKGIAVFAGNVSDNPAKIDIELFSVEPPQKLSVSAYRCDSKFFLEPLERMSEITDAYGIVVLDGREATLAIVRGTQIDIVKRMNSTAHAKIRKGGQSARRFERLIEESIERYYTRVGEAMDEYFLGRVKAVMVGGPGPTKEFFMKANTYNYQIKVLGVVDTGYTDEYGIREVLSKSEDLLSEQEAVKERAIIERFIKEVVKDGLAIYGETQVRDAIASNQVELILVSEGLTYERVAYQCGNCSEKQEKTVREGTAEERIKCIKCQFDSRLIEEEPLIEDLIDLARDSGIKVEVISTNTNEGAQFLQGFGGVGAFLRYKIR